MVKPDLHKRVEREQERQKPSCEPHTVIGSIKVGDPVYTQNFIPWPMWEPGYGTKIMGSRKYRE